MSVIETIEGLLARYCSLIDAGDFRGLGVLFAEARLTTADGATVAAGAEGVQRLYQDTTIVHADGTPRTRHLTVNVVVDRDPGGDHALATSDYVVFQAVETADPVVPIATGRYVDRVVHDRARDGWRFEERCMIPGDFGDVRRHLTFDPHHLGPT